MPSSTPRASPALAPPDMPLLEAAALDDAVGSEVPLALAARTAAVATGDDPVATMMVDAVCLGEELAFVISASDDWVAVAVAASLVELSLSLELESASFDDDEAEARSGAPFICEFDPCVTHTTAPV